MLGMVVMTINNKCGDVTSPDSPAMLHVSEGLDLQLIPEHLLAQTPGERVGVVTLHRGVQGDTWNWN